MSRPSTGLVFVERALSYAGRKRCTYPDPTTGRISLHVSIDGFELAFRSEEERLVVEVVDMSPLREVRKKRFLESPRIRCFDERHPVVEQALAALEQKPLSEEEIGSGLYEVRQRLVSILASYAENHSEHGIGSVQIDAFAPGPRGEWKTSMSLLEREVEGFEISGVEQDGRFTSS